MSTITGFKSNGGTPFAYLQDSNNASVAIGLDSAASDVFKISVSTAVNALPSTSPQIIIDPTANGNMTFTPNGTGKVIVSYMTSGAVLSSSSGVLTSVNGLDGQLIIGATGGTPAFSSVTAGTGISLSTGANSLTISASASTPTSFATNSGTATPAANVITIVGGTGITTSGSGSTVTVSATSTGLVETLTGNSGGAISPVAGTINVIYPTTAGTPRIIGSGNTLTLTVTDANSNTILGAAANSNGLGQFNTMLGGQAGAAITTGGNGNLFFGYQSGRFFTTGTNNVAIGNNAGGGTSGAATGTNNIAIGTSAGLNYLTTDSNNISFNSNSTTVGGQSNTLRIGNGTGSGSLQLARAFISGIDGVNVGSVAKVLTMASDQLGTAAITAGTGITVTPGANTITIAASATGVVQTLTGNSGGAISPTAGNINIVTSNGTPTFVGSGSSLTMNFAGTATNLAIGSSLPSLSGGTNNTAFGVGAMASLTSAVTSTAVGWNALNAMATGGANTAVGYNAMPVANALTQGNTAIGSNIFTLLSGGNGGNVGIGSGTGTGITTGRSNIFLGLSAGSTYNGANSHNISITAASATHEAAGVSNRLVIGAATGTGIGQLSSAFICGIDGVNVGSVAKVVTMASDQLGTATITAGSGITVTPTANTITIAMSGSTAGFTWNDVTTTTQTMVANNGYVADNAAQVTMTLPATAAFGTMIRVTGGLSGLSTGSWKIAQPAGVQIHYGNQNTTRGVTGSLTSTNQYDAIEMVCVVANTDWTVSAGTQGNITVA